MMNYLWGGMLLLGVIYGAFAGTLDGVTEAIINSAKEAVNLVIAIAGITAFWTGIMKIAEQAGLVEKLARRIQPLLRFLFPELKNQEKANYYISLNFLSNFLGLSHASTSSGLLVFQELDRLNGYSTIASKSMCTFLIINVSIITHQYDRLSRSVWQSESRCNRRTCHFCHRNEYAGSSDILQNYEWEEINELNL